MTHKITILWGESPEPGQMSQTYEFDTEGELAAFWRGVMESDGWYGYRTVEEGYVVPAEGYEE